MKRGVFITFEGTDGSGKTTVINGVKKVLIDLGYDIFITREPGGSEIAEKIRNVILDISNKAMTDKTEALLYAASRNQHLVEKVLPALKDHKIVLCDRFLDSSLAYQGYARGLGIEEVYDMNLFATDGILPDLTIYLSVSPVVGMSRKTKQKELDRLESEKITFHEKVFKGYEEVAKRFNNRIITINGERTPDLVIKDTLDVILKYLKEE